MAARSPRPASRRAATDPYGRLPPDVRAPGSYTEVPPTMDSAAPIGVVGTGYVGLVSAVCFAHLGHQLVCMDIDAAKIERLQKGDVPIYEPGLDKLIDDNASRLSFTTSYDELLDACHILFIAVDTPPSPSGDADLSRVQFATTEIARRGGRRLLVMKSTVPVGTGEKVVADLEALGATGITYASNPCLLYTSDAADDLLCVDLGGRRIIKKK